MFRRIVKYTLYDVLFLRHLLESFPIMILTKNYLNSRLVFLEEEE